MRILSTMTFALCLIMYSGCSSEPEQPSSDGDAAAGVAQSPQEPTEKTGTVTVTFQISETDTKSVVVEGISNGATVLSVLQQIDDPELEIQGAGSNSLLIGVAGVEQEADEGWTYTVNDEWADAGIGDFQVSPGDTIRWKYGGFNPE